MDKLLLKELPNIKGKRVLMRVDFNVPLDEGGEITDDSRIKASLPSIEYLLGQEAIIILMSHLGRPKGKADPKFSLAPCAKRLSKLLQKPIAMAPNCIGPETEKMEDELAPGSILLLENLRFHEAEEKPEKDPSFAEKLADGADFYVNDAFGTAHRAHSSTATITRFFPGKAAAGLLVEKEISFLEKCLTNPEKPFYAIIGGAKISTKTAFLLNLIGKVDKLFIGGGMAYTFFKAQKIAIGSSICEDNQIDTAKKIMESCQKKGCQLFLPEDIVIADAFADEGQKKTISSAEGIKENWQGMDIGAKTCQSWKEEMQGAKTIFWNGPLGVFELPSFAKGTKCIAEFLAHSLATTIVGGGDSLAAIHSLQLEEKFSHLSTGGGASLKFLEGGKLPGIEALSER